MWDVSVLRPEQVILHDAPSFDRARFPCAMIVDRSWAQAQWVGRWHACSLRSALHTTASHQLLDKSVDVVDFLTRRGESRTAPQWAGHKGEHQDTRIYYFIVHEEYATYWTGGRRGSRVRERLPSSPSSQDPNKHAGYLLL